MTVIFDQLLTLSREIYPDDRPDLVHMLCAWIIRDPTNELEGLFYPHKVTKLKLIQSLKPLFRAPSDQDSALLTQCILASGGGMVTGWDIWMALCKERGHRVTQTLVKAGLDVDRFQGQVEKKRTPVPDSLRVLGVAVKKETRALMKYGRNLTDLARSGCFNDLSDRPGEIDRLLSVLLRRQKCNAAITGPAGVGKTALVELFALKIVKGDFSSVLECNALFELSISRLLSGTKYRGDFEKRMEEVLGFVQAAQPAILFIDEMHQIWGAGRAEGAIMDAATMLKPALARGEFRVIGATTSEDYYQYIARDTALSRRFQEIKLQEPDDEVTLQMVSRQAKCLTRHHNVQISETAIQAAISMTGQHLQNKNQPDKSIELLDSTAVQVRRKGLEKIHEKDLYDTLALQTGCPVSMLSGRDRALLLSVADRLKERIVGQAHVIDRLAGILIQRRQGIGNKERNLGTFLFSGATGVGKTELARSLAAVFFENERALLHLDLAEYSRKGSVNNLIGSPPGYIGSEKGGVLASWLHDYPCGVLLFDEIEKASSEFHHLLLGILDNGRIRTAQGEYLNTRQCVVILTTNAISSEEIAPKAMGFHPGNYRPDVQALLSKQFSPEFLARFDELFLFHTLGLDALCQIMKLRLEEALESFKQKQINICFNETELVDYLLFKLNDTKMGARGIARLLEQYLLQPIAMALIKNDAAGGATFTLGENFYKHGAVDVQQPQAQSNRKSHEREFKKAPAASL